MVDRYELRDALLTAGVPPEAFRIAGVHEPVPVPPDFWFVRPTAVGYWEIGPHERGADEVRAVFESEDAACAQVYRALTGRGAPA